MDILAFIIGIIALAIAGAGLGIAMYALSTRQE